MLRLLRPEVHCKGADYAALDGKPISELAVVTDCRKDKKGKAGPENSPVAGVHQRASANTGPMRVCRFVLSVTCIT